MTRISKQQQGTIYGKQKRSSGMEHYLKCHGQFDCLHLEILCREANRKAKKVRSTTGN